MFGGLDDQVASIAQYLTDNFNERHTCQDPGLDINPCSVRIDQSFQSLFMSAHQCGLQVDGDRTTLRHPDTGNHMPNNIDDRQAGLVVLGQRNGAFQDMLVRLPVFHHAKNVFKALHSLTSF